MIYNINDINNINKIFVERSKSSDQSSVPPRKGSTTVFNKSKKQNSDRNSWNSRNSQISNFLGILKVM